jgi:mgtE-like transporter
MPEGTIGEIVREALPFELMCAFGGVLAGITLYGMRGDINSIPGLLVIVPAVLGMRGNISCALGSRLGSAIHMGLITAKIERNPELTNNIAASLILSFFMAIVLGLLGYYVSVFFGLPYPAGGGPLIFVSIALLAGMISGIILSGVAALLATATFRFGIDPDNVVTPALGTVGDIVTMLLILASARVMIWLFIT